MGKAFYPGYVPGTYKVYKTVGGWALMFVDEKGNTRCADGDQIYDYPSSAYRRAKQLNALLKEKAEKSA